jgi:hypothetical protein
VKRTVEASGAFHAPYTGVFSMAKKKKDDEVAQAESSDGSIAVNDAWTGMLAVSLLALVVGSGFLAYDYMQYNDEKGPPQSSKFTTTLPGVPPKVNPPPKVEPKDVAAKDADKKDAAKDADKKDAADKKDPEKKDA